MFVYVGHSSALSIPEYLHSAIQRSVLYYYYTLLCIYNCRVNFSLETLEPLLEFPISLLVNWKRIVRKMYIDVYMSMLHTNIPYGIYTVRSRYCSVRLSRYRPTV